MVDEVVDWFKRPDKKEVIGNIEPKILEELERDGYIQSQELLSKPSIISLEIGEMVSELSNYKVSAETCTNPRSRLNWDVIREYYIDKRKEIMDSGGVVFVYGSALFDDPRNNDGDIFMILFKENEVLESKAVNEWDTELTKMWKEKKVGADPHVTVTDFKKMNDLVSRFERTGDVDTWYFGETGEAISIILSASPLYPEMDELAEMMKKDAIKLMNKSQLLRLIVHTSLKSCLDVRKERRI